MKQSFRFLMLAILILGAPLFAQAQQRQPYEPLNPEDEIFLKKLCPKCNAKAWNEQLRSQLNRDTDWIEFASKACASLQRNQSACQENAGEAIHNMSHGRQKGQDERAYRGIDKERLEEFDKLYSNCKSLNDGFSDPKALGDCQWKATTGADCVVDDNEFAKLKATNPKADRRAKCSPKENTSLQTGPSTK